MPTLLYFFINLKVAYDGNANINTLFNKIKFQMAEILLLKAV